MFCNICYQYRDIITKPVENNEITLFYPIITLNNIFKMYGLIGKHQERGHNLFVQSRYHQIIKFNYLNYNKTK